MKPADGVPMYVVAIEYCGPDLPAAGGAGRQPVIEHAYDATAATLAHEDQSTRIGFTDPVRGWPTRACAPRCPACTTAVKIAITAVIARAITDLADRTVHLSAPRPAATDDTRRGAPPWPCCLDYCAGNDDSGGA